jgi:hypothetical protein
VKLTRRFSLVPARAGATRLPGLRIDWWDVEADATRTATLPPMSWSVAAADGTPSPSAVTAAAGVAQSDNAAPAATEESTAPRIWVVLALVFAALWLFTLVWGLHLRAQHAPAAHAREHAAAQPAAAPRQALADFRRALEVGDFGEVEDLLCAMAVPPVRGVDALRARLDDGAQQDAVEALQRARWGGGDGVHARRLLRSAFAEGPRWRSTAPAAAPSLLPPLYPPG